MSAPVDSLIARLLGLHIKLLACQARLRAETDAEALHDLRTSVRRLRSLLRPLRELPGVDRLEAAAKGVGDLTTPLRDREVLAAHLLAHGQTALGQRRLEQMRGVFVQVADSQELALLLAVLDAFPSFVRSAQRQGLLKGLAGKLHKRLDKQWHKLRAALKDSAHDRHRLRLLIKRVRYSAEAYPEYDRLPDKAANRLKKAQAALGDWHDAWQWLARAGQEPDLQPCVPGWQVALHDAEKHADKVLDGLLALKGR
ncbi:CHAD domain-containing protein [Pseudomonas sp. HR96]|uniref:CHAD domain-containing protein n=1 Tax=Pseudomonas sp. HR96 TaxID=1027966 RepID=UPI002A74AFFB|nr:CHAD domain-containing protein [Pseudomonas sp. HR96]WPO98568.1 CHAD domain-containing protein [Pseudomonas sp. HR96]